MNFYFVKPSYVGYLKTIDPKVPDVQYAKRNKFLCGVVLDVNGKQYFSPVSSFKKQQRTNFIIEDKNGNAVSSLRLSFMLPIPQEQLSPYVIAQEPDQQYRSLLMQELAYIQAHESEIKQKASDVYAIGNNPSHYLAKNCCDFAKLEREATAAGYQKFLAEQQAGKNGTVSTAPGASAAAASQQAPAAATADPASSIPAAPTDASTASAASGEAPALDQTGAAAASPQLLSMVATIAAQPSAPGAQKQSVKKNEIVNE